MVPEGIRTMVFDTQQRVDIYGAVLIIDQQNRK